MGFKGMVMTDWFYGKDAVAQMKAGNDLPMPGTPAQKQAIMDAVKNGTLDVKILDANAERIVNYILGSQAYKNMPSAISRTLRNMPNWYVLLHQKVWSY